MPYCVYILASRKHGTLYIGVTNDISRRIWEHRQGRGSRFVKRYRVTQLVYVEMHEEVVRAIQREKTKRKKAVVLTLIDRKGEARTFHVRDVKKSTLQTIVRPNIDGRSAIMTDDDAAYDDLHKHFHRHKSVRHKETFVRGLVHTNFAESYHSLLKRSIFGARHQISEKHLSRYLREREFHWNRRKATDGERTVDAIAGAKGKRLMYRMPA